MAEDNPSSFSASPRIDDHPGPRAVAFPEDSRIREEKIRPKGVEMKRTMTQEEKDLAAAGYEHLHPSAKDPKLEETNVDIYEHKLTFEGLVDALKTNVDFKDPAHSFGLSTDEAKTKLHDDGPNVLTPPKKKSALRKVKFSLNFEILSIF